MSGRESVGDLIPQDVAEVFAHERQTKGGRRKKRGGSLGRAFSWFKGKKKKEVKANGQIQDFHSVGPKTGKISPQGHSHAVPKQEDEGTQVPSHVQENVFIEGSRPKYLEDLHTEAQEGLKLQQQEETNNGVDYQDDQSIASTVTRQPDETESDSYRERRGSLSDSTILDTMSQVSTRSAVSTRSSRSGLTRQASTFRPLKSEKKPEKTKARRRHRRTTVMGIPQHIQRELGLDRASWAARRVIDEDGLHNGESLDIHTIDGPHLADSQEGVRIYLQSVEGLQPVSEDQVQKFPSRAGHTDDLALLQRMGPQLCGLKRPNSLAVPWMTTVSGLPHHPPSPVMSMSPQATYMSKIIPNAVLPPSIDVVEISHNRSRSSVRTVSKSRLLLASPASSRASSRTSAMSSASRYNPPHFSDSSGWSHSESSETLVSDSSTVSSNSTTRQGGDGEGSSREMALDRESIHSSVSKASRTSTIKGKGKARGDDGKQEGPFIRSLSVMKSKRAPAPPSRSYSLHKDKMKRRSRDLTDIRVAAPTQSSPVRGGEAKAVSAGETGSSPMPSSNKSSPGYTADTSSLDESSGSVTTNSFHTRQQAAREEERNEQPGSTGFSPQKQTPQENILKKTVSPSSCYPSPGGMPTLPSKQTHNSSPGNKRGILAKLASIFPKAPSPSPVIQPQASDSRKTPRPSPPVDTVTSSPSVMALRELFNIPPPPKVCAPSPPPPEVWAHNKRTFELLLGPPAPNNTDTLVRKNPKDRRQQRQSPSTSREASESAPEQEAGGVLDRVTESLSKEQTSNPAALTSVSGNGQESPRVQEKDGLSPVVIEVGDKGPTQIEPSEGMKRNSEVAQKVEQERVQGSQLVVEPEKVKVSQMIGKLEKVHQASRLVNEKSVNASVAPGRGLGKVNTEIQTPATEKRTESQLKMDTLSMLSPTLARVSPSPSPPPAHYPPLPPSKQTPPVTILGVPSDSSPAPELPLVYTTGESFWPPPPPPMDLATLGDELDLPLPPPPSGCEEGVIMTEPVPPVSEGTVGAPNPARPAPQEVSSVPQGIPQPSPGITECQNQEKMSLGKSSPTPPEEAPTPVVTPSLLQMIKLRSVNNGDQGLKKDQSQGQNHTEVTLRAKQPSNGEAPQKPIRRSLIMTAPPPTVTSPPTTVVSQLPTATVPEAALTSATVPEAALTSATVPEAALTSATVPEAALTSVPTTTTAKFQPSIVNLPSKSSTVTSPTSKSPSASATMRMQEAIRLRTEARSKEGPPSHLSLHSPTSPTGLKFPSSTASFIFAKSTKKVVIETLSTPEAQANLTKKLVAELSSMSNPSKSIETQKEVAVKVPPPVARKPRLKVTDAEPSVETEHVQTAGQEAQPADNTEGAPEAPNGTAVSVEVSPSSSST
ncbi:NHS-like protein 3 isoform X2 [Oncorhynchus clarkii lewisi]|uniref:NHS-like protein 3 isoform X2 n=1 Tax=Oncorhynchus clarkii lewisi TaxID=490388 RepID=UPI0039B92ADD